MPRLKYLLYLVGFFLVLNLAFLFSQKLFSNQKLKTAEINGQKILVEVADNDAMRSKGLSGRAGLAADQGMIFLFDNPDYYAFWMKDMLIPLDFIWINNNEIVEIDKNIKPQDYQPPQVLVPRAKADKVLEVNAGLTDKLNIKVGDKVAL